MYSEVYSLLVFSCVFCYVLCYSFNTKDVIRIGDVVSDAYFSYTLLLQSRERESALIVGAPRKGNTNLGGDIYRCNINSGGSSSCDQYRVGRTIPSNNVNGNFFGMSLDGEDHFNGAVVACAPRAVTSKGKNINYQRGQCVFMRNSSQLYEENIRISPLNNGLYTDTSCCLRRRAYWNFAFSMAGFDVSYYSEKKPELLLGAPGVKQFNGATISYSIDDQGISLMPTRTKPVEEDHDSYLGYFVTTAKFMRNDQIWFIAGAPRANDLKGKVIIFFHDVTANEKMKIVATFYGDEAGSYFGASVLALDTTDDGLTDLLIGAPMTAGNTWDEGKVYFYKGLNVNSFQQGVKLTGSSKMGSRFGTAVVSLGDFDLDGYNDIAVSAPYEDNGKGAVYIYKGSPEGLSNQYSQRVIAADLNIYHPTTKGFGMGISKGNDIDGNGHSDIAIGAYKSDEIYIIKTYIIIDYQFFLSPRINTITNDSAFEMQFCLIYTKRSNRPILPQVKFNISIDLDYRAVDSSFVDQINANLGNTLCKIYRVQIRNIMTDISPFQIDLKVHTDRTDIIAHGAKSLEIKIPYSHGCGDDNVCDTDLTLDLLSNSENVTLGLDKQFNLTVIVNNKGEPAYQCEVRFINVPGEIEMRNSKDCEKNDRNYTCIIDERLIDSSQKDFIFDIKEVNPELTGIAIAVEVTSLGHNKEKTRNKANFKIPVILDSSPYIIGKSFPENLELDIKSTKDMEVIHQFSIGKIGPSPHKLNVDILLPILEHNSETIFNVLEVTGVIDNVQVSCVPSGVQAGSDFNGLDDSKVPLNRSIVISCNDENQCLKYNCQGEYLYDSANVAVFRVKVSIRSALLVSKYKTALATRDLIAFVPIAFQNSPSNRVAASSLFLVFIHGVHIVPLWLYIAAPTVGVIILLLISYGLYKCHFFDRVYKDKLDQEKILESNNGSIGEETIDDVVLRPMSENIENENKSFDYN